MSKRNMSLEAARGICSVLIVLIHCPFPGRIGQLLTGLGRVAVPFFFMISGYFCYHGEDREVVAHAKRKFIETLKMVGILAAVYVCANVGMNLALSGSVVWWLSTFCNWKALWELLFLNQAGWISMIMWYPLALLYVYAIVALLGKGRCRWLLYGAVPVLLLGNLVVSELLRMNWKYAANFLLTGLPFFGLGHWLRHVNIAEKRVHPALLFLGVGAGLVLTALEVRRNAGAYCYVGSIVIAVYVFVWCLQNRLPRWLGWLGRFGNAYATYLFALHCLIRTAMEFLPVNWYQGFPQWLAPLVTITVTLALSWVVRRVPAVFLRKRPVGN